MKEKMIAKRQSGKRYSQPPQSCDNAGIDWDHPATVDTDQIKQSSSYRLRLPRDNQLSKVYHKLAELTPNHGAIK
jgi:hypothetical protein